MDYGVLIRQLQGALGGNRIVAGIVASDGTIVAGKGFSVSKGATGLYNITFTHPFSGVPSVRATPGPVVGGITVKHNSRPTKGSAALVMLNLSAAPVDCEFNFEALGPG